MTYELTPNLANLKTIIPGYPVSRNKVLLSLGMLALIGSLAAIAISSIQAGSISKGLSNLSNNLKNFVTDPTKMGITGGITLIGLVILGIRKLSIDKKNQQMILERADNERVEIPLDPVDLAKLFQTTPSRDEEVAPDPDAPTFRSSPRNKPINFHNGPHANAILQQPTAEKIRLQQDTFTDAEAQLLKDSQENYNMYQSNPNDGPILNGLKAQKLTIAPNNESEVDRAERINKLSLMIRLGCLLSVTGQVARFEKNEETGKYIVIFTSGPLGGLNLVQE